MASERNIHWIDIERAAHLRAPQLAELVIQYMDQPDPPEDRSEQTDATASVPPLPREAWTLARLRQSVGRPLLASKTAEEQRTIRRSSWDALASAAYPPPRLGLGTLLLEIYEQGDEPGRGALETIFMRARIGWGLWQGFKQIYKLAEQRHDAAMFGILAWRLDAMSQTPIRSGEVSEATFVYMRRRAWRYLRQLGRDVPEAYPQFAIQVLRHYPHSFNFWSSWIASQIWGHQQLHGQGQGGLSGPPSDLTMRAFAEAWQQSADPLLRLLEDVNNSEVGQFAIQCLIADFPERLRRVEPTWLIRVGQNSLSSIHDLVARILREDPRFHPAKLADLGLRTLALCLLRSPSAQARHYAVDYARAQAPDLPIEQLIELATEGVDEVQALATERIEAYEARTVDLSVWVRLLGCHATASIAEKKLRANYEPHELDVESFIALWSGTRAQQRFVTAWFESTHYTVPAEHWIALLDDDRLPRRKRSEVLGILAQYSGAEIGLDWIKQALIDPRDHDWAGQQLRAGMFKGDDLDVEWIKGLVMRPKLRPLAVEILANPAIVTPATIGLPWLLAMLRQPDPSLHQLAHRYMLEHCTPYDFAGSSTSSGLDKLWTLAAGRDQPARVRTFAATYLRVHHPQLGPTLTEGRDLGIQPRLVSEDYGIERVSPLFDDPRPDVRALARDLAHYEMGRWTDGSLPYRLAHSRYAEAREAAYDQLLRWSAAPSAQSEDDPSADGLRSDALFMLAESPHASTRAVGLTLIRRAYHRVDGVARLAWLMESPDREVRLFAVRLLWENHRPRARHGRPPPTSSPHVPDFETTEALRDFLRSVLFGLPPGRRERREPSPEARPDRPLCASVAKQRLLAVVAEFSEEDADFAAMALPILEAFTHSQSQGERHGCIAALATIRRAHPQLSIDLPPGFTVVRAPRRPRFGASIFP